MVILHACFDESGKWRDSNYLAFSGYISWINVWSAFSVQWQALLKSYNMAALHMADERRPNVLMDFAKIIKSTPLLGVGVAVDANAYRALSEQDKALLEYEPKPFAFFKALSAIIERADMADKELGLICDDDQEYSIECYKLLNRAKLHDAKIKDKVFSICFADDKKYVPLQAADMLAYLTRQELIRRATSPKDPVSPVFSFLTGKPTQGYGARHIGYEFTSESLRDLVKRLRLRRTPPG